ncbi:MAG: PmoA family protein [Verrucomicrobia bacterium]|nr:PmoA family protein [Verrucomicrobiota bacterium]
MPWAKSTFAALACGLAVVGKLEAAVIHVSDNENVADRNPVPVSVEVDLQSLLGERTRLERLALVEVNAAGVESAKSEPVQFEADAPGSSRGRLWWLLPPGAARERRFKLHLLEQDSLAELTVKADATRSRFDISEGPLPVLRYNHGTVPVPAGIDTNYARGDYIALLFGPSGELLTDDYPKDHPHHRAVSWSWPVTRWGDEVRDIWAVRGVWARPAAMRRVEAGPVLALLGAESVWKWADTTPIVREEVVIRAFRRSGGDRFVDVEVRLVALDDRVAIGGRPHGGYGGFGLRAQPAQQRKITLFTDPPGASPRRSWLDYSGVFAGGKGPAGLAIFEHVANPLYPSELKEYPDLNYVMPAFPGEREVPLSMDKPLVLRHRLWIHEGTANEQKLAAVWAAYANPPKAELAEK